MTLVLLHWQAGLEQYTSAMLSDGALLLLPVPAAMRRKMRTTVCRCSWAAA
jgi:hypothetical protein